MKKITFVLLSIFILSGSLWAGKLSKINLAGLYNEDQFTRPEKMVFHTSASISTVYLNINLNDLKYNSTDSGTAFAEIKIHYELYESWKSKNPIDSANLVIMDYQDLNRAMLRTFEFDVKAVSPGNYLLKYTLTDAHKPENAIIDFIEINKSSKNSTQNFFITDEDGYPVFGYQLPQGENFYILFNDTDTDTIYIRYYNRKFPLAKPPYALEKEKIQKFYPDSVFSIILNEGKSEMLSLPFHGIYHFQADLSIPDGLTLYQFDDGFPEVNSPALAIASLRYLTTNIEFEKLLSYKDYKVAVDSFWLIRASAHPGRAKNMIKRYYSRVQDANKLFSSYHEGWKTDRGLMYIIYGPPSEVYRDGDEEEWIYGERGNPLSMRFYFYKLENPFTQNDYSLNRSTTYKTSWYIAIENWRR
ncbi:MAG: GWxTD domain-containing protein [Bacteroidales bacterium]|nr:GWxTD domain-containing protein [Bacteroidales bacterium]MCF8405284.1 GWxTD domain-containing protein [Bacteroidales bacterium]